MRGRAVIMGFGRRGRSIISIAAVVGTALAVVVSNFALARGLDDRSMTAPEVSPRTDCNLPQSTQALISQGDRDSYFLAPGGDFEGAGAADWYMDGGAQVTKIVNRDGTTNGVLQIPAGGQAASPVVCVTADCPHARIFARNIGGSADKIQFGVSYYRDGAWSKWKKTADAKGRDRDWGLSGKLNIQPEKKDGYQQVRFAFYNDTRDTTFELDDLWVDPRASR